MVSIKDWNFLIFVVGVFVVIVCLFYIGGITGCEIKPKEVIIGSSMSTTLIPFGDYNTPPVKTCEYNNITGCNDVRPITYGTFPKRSFTQVGILTNNKSGGETLIIPLYGRRVQRNRFQYYTLSNTGFVNSKLAIMIKNKSALDEYGVDEINDGDVVFVKGYDKNFRVSIYENSYGI